jgi:DNA invertase Pin-like site-specific DNA recombinase
MKVCVYARVSRNSQELEQQIAACRRFCDYKGFEIAAIYSEKLSGAKAKRPEYLRMVSELRAFRYDGVVVFRLDRLGRNSRELALLIDELEAKGVKVLSVNESFDTSTALGRAMRELIYIFAQLEREQISEATAQRLQALKAVGKRLGRKLASPAQIKRVQALRAEGLSVRAIARNSQLSKSTVANIVQQKGAYAFLRDKTPEYGCPTFGN